MKLKVGDIVEDICDPSPIKYGIVTKIISNKFDGCFHATWYKSLNDLDNNDGGDYKDLDMPVENVKVINHKISPLYKTLTKDVK